jgi:hypothetical protein
MGNEIVMDTIHRILTGTPLTHCELRIGGILVMLWFLMDLVQWIDWLWSKF